MWGLTSLRQSCPITADVIIPSGDHAGLQAMVSVHGHLCIYGDTAGEHQTTNLCLYSIGLKVGLFPCYET